MAASAGGKQPGRGPGRRFEKGASGNPSGRKAGVRNRITLAAEKILEGGARDVADAVVKAACGGDMTAARLVLDRIYPPRRGRPIVFPLPKIGNATEVGNALASIASLMADGTLTPEEANAVASVIEVRRKAIETTELETRLRVLEEQRS